MSLFTKVQSAATEFQLKMAKMQGMEKSTNTLLPSGQSVIGVYGYPLTTQEPMLSGGYRKRTNTILTITRDQITLKELPAFNNRIVRTDITPNVKYIVNFVDTQDPILWRLILVNFYS